MVESFSSRTVLATPEVVRNREGAVLGEKSIQRQLFVYNKCKAKKRPEKIKNQKIKRHKSFKNRFILLRCQSATLKVYNTDNSQELLGD